KLKNIPFEYRLGPRYLYGEAGAEILFTDNETNAPRVWGPGATSRKLFVKDAFHRYIANGETEAVNPAGLGTKSCLRYQKNIPAGKSVVVKLRLSPNALDLPLQEVDAIFNQRRKEADEFYNAIHPPKASEDEKRIQRQAFAGMMWGKQIYLFDVATWLDGD